MPGTNESAILDIEVRTARALDEMRAFTAEARVLVSQANQMGGATKNADAGFMSMVRSMALWGAAAMAAQRVIGFVASGLKDAAHEAVAVAQLDAAIASSGGRLKKTADDWRNYASAMQSTFGVADDLVLKAASIAASFELTDDEIARLLPLAADLSARLGMDLPSAAQALAKALQDPDEGIMALQRNLRFLSEGQRLLVKDLIDAGQREKAQTIILGELEKAVGGAAAAHRNTLVGAVETATNAIGDMSEIIGNAAAPGIRELVEGFIDAGAESQNLRSSMQSSFDGIGELIGGVAKAIKWLLTGLNEARALFAVVQAAALDFAAGVLKAIAWVMEGYAKLHKTSGNWGAAVRETSTDLSTLAESFREVALEQWDVDDSLAKVTSETKKTTAANRVLANSDVEVTAAQKKLADGLRDVTRELISSLAARQRELEALYASGEARDALEAATRKEAIAAKLQIAAGDERLAQIGAALVLEQRLLRAREGMAAALASLAEADEAAYRKIEARQNAWTHDLAEGLRALRDLEEQARSAAQEVGLLNDSSMRLSDISLELNVSQQLSRIDPDVLNAVNTFFAWIGRPSMEAQIRANTKAIMDAGEAAQIKRSVRGGPLVEFREQEERIRELRREGLLTATESETALWQLRKRYTDDLVSQISSVTGYLAEALGGVFVQIDTLVRRIQGAQQFGQSVSQMASGMGASSGTASMIGGIASVFAVYWAVWSAVDEWGKKQRGKKFTQVGQLEIDGSLERMMGFSEIGMKFAQGLRDVANTIEDALGATIESMAKVQVRGSADGKKFRAWVDGELVGTFASMGDAISAAMTRALSTMEFSGMLDPLVAQGIGSAPSSSIEDALDFLSSLKKISEISLGPDAAAMRQAVVDFDRLFNTLSALAAVTPEVVQGFANIAAAEGLAWQQQRDSITGRKKTAEEQLAEQQQRAMIWNAEKALRIADLQSRKLNLEAYKAYVEGQLGLTSADMQVMSAALSTGQEFIKGKTYILGQDGKLKRVEIEVSEASLRAQLEMLNAQLAAIDAILAAMPADISLDEIQLPDVGGYSDLGTTFDDTAQAAAALREELDSVARGQLPDLTRELAELMVRFDDLRERATEYGFSLEEVDRLLAGEIAAIRRRLEDELLGYIAQGGADPMTSEIGLQMAEIARWADELRANADELGLSVELINAAEEARIAMLRQAVADQVAEFADPFGVGQAAAIRKQANDLRKSIRDLGLDAEETARLLADVDLGENLRIQQGVNGLLDQLYQYLADDVDYQDEILAFRQMQFTLEMEIIRQQLIAYGVWAQYSKVWEDALAAGSKAIGDAAAAASTVGSGGGSNWNLYDERAQFRERLQEYMNLSIPDGFNRELADLTETFEDLYWEARQLGIAASEVDAAWVAATRDLMNRVIDPIRQLQRDLFSGSLSQASPEQQLASLQAAAQAEFQAAMGGDLDAYQRFADIARRLAELAQGSFGGGIGAAAYMDMIRQWLASLEAAGVSLGADPLGNPSDPSLTGTGGQGIGGDRGGATNAALFGRVVDSQRAASERAHLDAERIIGQLRSLGVAFDQVRADTRLARIRPEARN